MSSKNDIDLIINNLSQNNYTFDENLLVKDEIELLKNRARDSRAIYGLNTPIGTNIFSFLEQKADVVFQLQDFKKSDLDAMIIKYSSKSLKKYIIINSDKPLINQVFAAAHELYHYSYSFIENSLDSFVCSFNKNDKEEIKANRFLSASNYLDYNNQLATEALTPAPKGYEAFYLTHYGRHGSRWLIGRQEYDAPLMVLREAHRNGKLTEVGEEVLKKLEAFHPTTINRLGELTTVGERQHHGIGKRMVQNFPEIFLTKNVNINARSTVVIRCILSMEAECEELAAANPTARFHNDVSESFQYYLNAPWEGQVRKNSGKGREELSKFRYENTHPDRLMKVLFNDQTWVYNNVQASSLMRQLFDIASNMQSHDTDIEFYSLFTDDEVYDLWRVNNAGWYLNYGAAPQTGGVMPFSQLNLLKNIIATSDTITTTQATLRFGHEVCVMPLACLLELGNCGVVVNDLNKLDEQWRNYRIFPMASNIQIIFYRPKKGKTGDILVKAMLNEREVSLPIQTDQYPYYKWADLRKYYMDKIAKYEANE